MDMSISEDMHHSDEVNRKSLESELREKKEPEEKPSDESSLEISMAEGDLTDSQICDETKKADKL